METKEIMKMVLSPKIWLLIVLVLHTAVGVIAQTDFSVDAEAERAGVFLAISAYLAYAAFLTSGQEQARLAAVLAGPIWVWFVVCTALGLEGWEGIAVPPLFIWGMLALSGLMSWNMEND